MNPKFNFIVLKNDSNIQFLFFNILTAIKSGYYVCYLLGAI